MKKYDIAIEVPSTIDYQVTVFAESEEQALAIAKDRSLWEGSLRTSKSENRDEATLRVHSIYDLKKCESCGKEDAVEEVFVRHLRDASIYRNTCRLCGHSVQFKKGWR